MGVEEALAVDEETAWEKITNLTNKADFSQSDNSEIRSLMRWLPDEKRRWLEEGLFLSEVKQPTEQSKGNEDG